MGRSPFYNGPVFPEWLAAKRPAVALAAWIGLAFAATAAASIAGRHFQIENGVSIFYPTTAVSILACMTLGIPGAIGVLLGVIATPWGPHISSSQLLISAVLTTAEGLIPWLVFRLRRDLSSDLRDLRSLVAFLLCGTIVNTAFSAVAGNLLIVPNPAGTTIVWRQVFLWWIADFTAALLLATPVLAFGGALAGGSRRDHPRTLTNALQVVAAVILLGFGASFALRTFLLERLERERLAQQRNWVQAQETLNRMQANLIRSAFLRSEDPAAPAKLDAAKEVNDRLLRMLEPFVAASFPTASDQLLIIAQATTRWFDVTRTRLVAAAAPGESARILADNGRSILALRTMIERVNSTAWDEFSVKRRRLMVVSAIVDATVLGILVFATVVLLYTISRPFVQLRAAVRAMGEGEALDSRQIDARYLEFRSIARRLESTSRELRRREEELRLQTERAVAASKHKSEFLAKMSHELRTPLNSIIGFSDLLAEQEKTMSSEKRLAFLEIVASSARHLLGLINDLLDIAKVEAGRMELHLENIDLRLSVANTVASTQPLFARKGQQVDVIAPDVPMMARADRGRIEQVLLNLLSNANRFTSDGERITVRCSPDEPQMWRIEIADRGIGIRVEDQERIFLDFEQVQDRAGPASGTGLGLALARRFAEAHGGDIGVESTPGEGSIFRVRIPRA